MGGRRKWLPSWRWGPKLACSKTRLGCTLQADDIHAPHLQFRLKNLISSLQKAPARIFFRNSGGARKAHEKIWNQTNSAAWLRLPRSIWQPYPRCRFTRRVTDLAACRTARCRKRVSRSASRTRRAHEVPRLRACQMTTTFVFQNELLQEVLMKNYIVMALMVGLCAVCPRIVTSNPPAPSAAAEECKDCGCAGPNNTGKCPDEEGNTCKCPKK